MTFKNYKKKKGEWQRRQSDPCTEMSSMTNVQMISEGANRTKKKKRGVSQTSYVRNNTPHRNVHSRTWEERNNKNENETTAKQKQKQKHTVEKKRNNNVSCWKTQALIHISVYRKRGKKNNDNKASPAAAYPRKTDDNHATRKGGKKKKNSA